MTPDPARAPLLTRRRVLASAGLVAVGALAAEAANLGIGALGAPGPDAARIGAGPGAGSAEQPGATASAGATSPVTAAAAASTAPGPRRVFRTRPDIAAPLVEVTTLAGIPAAGHVFLTPANGEGRDGPTIVDAAGDLVWMRPDTGGYATDLRAGDLDGRPVLTWWEGANNAGIGVGEHVVVDASYREVARIRGTGDAKTDLHELRLTSRRTALYFAYASVGPGRVAGSAAPVPLIMDCAVQEVDIASGDLVFEWRAADHVDVAESMVDQPTAGGSVYDFFHGNSIEEDGDGNLIVSARNTSAVYKIERGSGRVMWRLGGRRSDFEMGTGAAFALQHDARRQADGTLTIFDDGQSPDVSRGIVLRLDEAAMRATLVQEYRQPAGLSATSQGSLQVLPGGHAFIGWGSVPRFSEFTADGRLVLDAGFTASQSYRGLRFPWTGTPADPPAAAVDADQDGAVVYASWNGATEVAAWDVLAGGSPAALRQVATAPRRGFETVIGPVRLEAGDSLVAVRARDVTGRTLGTSDPVVASG